jgi:hypothetical protein
MNMSRILTFSSGLSGRSRPGTQPPSQEIPPQLRSQLASQATSPPPRKLQALDISVQGIQLPRSIQETLSDAKSFKPRGDGNFTTIDIFSSPEVHRCGGSHKSQTKLELHDWLKKEIEVEVGWRNWGMKLVICPAQSATGASAWPLTMDLDTWRLICKTMGFSERLIETVRGHNGKYMRFYEDDIEGFMLHGRNPGFSYITTYDYKTKQTYGVVFGLSEDDIKKVAEVIVDTQKDLSCWPPVYVAICLLERKAGWIEDSSTRSYQELVKTEKQIGTFTDYFLEAVPREPEWLQTLDTETIVRNLTIISTSISRSEHQCKIAEGMLVVMESAYTSYLEHLKAMSVEQFEEDDRATPLKELSLKPPQRRATTPNPLAMPSSPPVPPPSPMKLGFDTSANKHLRNRASELKCVMQVLLLECEFYHRRAEANRQTVYSLIAQKDNGISLQIARAGMRQSTSMKRIAEVNTRDSAAMVIISIVTVIFLPGTFVSSLFSTTIFNFQSPNGSAATNNKWHGVYWAITAPLTLFILSIGFIFWFIRKDYDKKRVTGIERETEQVLTEAYGGYSYSEKDDDPIENTQGTGKSQEPKPLENGATTRSVPEGDAGPGAEKLV